MEQTPIQPVSRKLAQRKHTASRPLSPLQDAVISEGKELLLGDAYWLNRPKPKPVLWRNLTNGVVQDVLRNLRQRLEGDDIECKLPLDDNVLRWKLLPWLRDNQCTFNSGRRAIPTSYRACPLRNHC